MKKIFLLISLVLISCSNSDDSDEFSVLSFDQNDFEKNRQLWKENEILNYTFSQEYFSTSIGGQPVLTSVVKNKVLDAIFVQTGYNTDFPIEEMTYYGTIDDAYHFIEYIVNSCEEQINSDEGPMKGAKIDVEYDDIFYYPTKINCTGYYPDGLLGGLSVHIIFSNFEVNQ